MFTLTAGDSFAFGLAEQLLGAQVVETAPPGESFTFRSGRQAPCKFIAERALAHPLLRASCLYGLSMPMLKDPGRGLLFAGVPNGGTPWAVLLAEKLCGLYRHVEKGDGGTFKTSGVEVGLAKPWIVEDVITEGISSRTVAQSFASGSPMFTRPHRVALMSYNFDPEPHFAVVGFGHLLEAMRRNPNYGHERIRNWYDDEFTKNTKAP